MTEFGRVDLIWGQLSPHDNEKDIWLFINTAKQVLSVCRANEVIRSFAVSTAFNGIGCEQDSFKTPCGWHEIAQKIGEGCKKGEIIKARQPTNQQAQISYSQCSTNQDLITTRILWLSGLDRGINLGDGVDSFSRYIYIHGTHEEGRIGLPVSKGCIRMKNADVIKLFDQVSEGTRVWIDG